MYERSDYATNVGNFGTLTDLAVAVGESIVAGHAPYDPCKVLGAHAAVTAGVPPCDDPFRKLVADRQVHA